MTLFRCFWAPTDFEEAFGFLADVLALPVVARWDDDGLGAIFQAPGAQIEIFGGAPGDASDDDRPHRPLSASSGEPPFGLAWEVPDVDVETAAIRQRGGSVTSPPTDRPWGLRMATVCGPDGIRVSVFSPADRRS